MTPLVLAVVALVAYLLGSIPVGYLAGRSRGIDIRQHGSGNIGATNVFRVLGRRLGTMVFICDVAKGILAVRLAMWTVDGVWLLSRWRVWDALTETKASLSANYTSLPSVHYITLPPAQVLGMVAAICCVLGHTFPCWLRFKGGKGVATSAGVLIGLLPLETLIILAVWLVVFFATRFVSLASILAAAALPVAVFFRLSPPVAVTSPVFYFSLAMAMLVVWRHRANIGRLVSGRENRFVKSKPK